jgi:O-succinylbenzoic acid--CoA ligase
VAAAPALPGAPAPASVALVEGKRSLTYGELALASARAARRLAGLGVRRGDRVATTLPAGVEFGVLLHAAPRIGAVLVPLSPRLPGAERARLVEAAGARVVVDEPLAGAEADVPLGEGPEPDAPHTLLFTSGTTGAPKPVLLTWANHRASAQASAANLGVASGERWLCCLPVHHVGGLAILVRSGLYGTTAVLRPAFDADAVAASLAAGEATLISLVATMVRRLAAAGLERPPALRAALVGGGPVPADLLEWGLAHGVSLVPTYGMTETASQVVTAAPEEALALGGAAGRPLPGVEVRIGPGGEILLRGPMVAAGALASDGWLHTGDRGRVDSYGYVWIEGRLDEVIVSGGENVAAREVEEVLLAHPAVREAAVVGRPDPEWGNAVSAFVVLAEPAPEDALIAHCRERLAGFKVPKTVTALEALPRTDSGKVRRGALTDPARIESAR